MEVDSSGKARGGMLSGNLELSPPFFVEGSHAMEDSSASATPSKARGGMLSASGNLELSRGRNNYGTGGQGSIIGLQESQRMLQSSASAGLDESGRWVGKMRETVCRGSGRGIVAAIV